MSEGSRRRERMNKVTGETQETARLSGNAVALQLVVRSFYHETLYLRWVLAHSPFHDSNIPVSKPLPHPDHRCHTGLSEACLACSRRSKNGCEKQLWEHLV